MRAARLSCSSLRSGPSFGPTSRPPFPKADLPVEVGFRCLGNRSAPRLARTMVSTRSGRETRSTCGRKGSTVTLGFGEIPESRLLLTSRPRKNRAGRSCPFQWRPSRDERPSFRQFPSVCFSATVPHATFCADPARDVAPRVTSCASPTTPAHSACPDGCTNRSVARRSRAAVLDPAA